MDTTTPAGEQPAQFRFTGEAGEYFRIWIVNLALTIVTLGVYSAWATVRKRRYFHTHTVLADGTFDYHASPKAILIGRLIAVAMIGVYYLSSYLHPFAPVAVAAAVFLAVPWFVVRSRRFRMRVTSYRNVRFDFRGSYGDAFKTYYVAALVYVITLGLATARANHMRAKFNVSNTAFGTTPFTFGGSLSTFYSYFWRSAGLFLLVAIGFGALSALLDSAGPSSIPAAEEAVLSYLVLDFLLLVALLLGYAAVGVYYQVCMRNHVYSTTELGDSTIHSNLEVGKMLGLYATNFLAIVFSLGLAVPWAQIRLAKYRAECTSMLLAEDWESYLATTADAGTAIGDEVGEAFDVDLGLGF